MPTGKTLNRLSTPELAGDAAALHFSPIAPPPGGSR
jgi:hypothetical protein